MEDAKRRRSAMTHDVGRDRQRGIVAATIVHINISAL